MSDLTGFRDHARAMAAAVHKPDCPATSRWATRAPGRRWLQEQPWAPATCNGCVPAADRALFARLADEIDQYLEQDPDPGTDDQHLEFP